MVLQVRLRTREQAVFLAGHCIPERILRDAVFFEECSVLREQHHEVHQIAGVGSTLVQSLKPGEVTLFTEVRVVNPNLSKQSSFPWFHALKTQGL